MTMKTSDPRRGRLAVMISAVLLAALFLAMPGAGTAALAAGGQSDFAASDRDGNGTLDSEEFRDRMVETFYLLDKNGDGHLTMDELPAASHQDFAAADKNGDGVLSRAEVKAAEARQ